MNSQYQQRSRWFFASGHLLTGLVLLFFLVIYIPVGLVGQYWKPLLFSPLQQLGDSCTYFMQDDQGQVTPEEPIVIPHGNLTRPAHFSQKMKVIYNCKVPPLAEVADGHIAHWGWLLGNPVSVAVNGQQHFHYNGKSKPTLHINGGERVQFVVETTKPVLHMVGFAGVQPPVITSNYADLLKVSGLELFLKVTRPLNFLTPIISLSLVIGLSWLAGYRARILTMGMFVLVWSFLWRFLELMTTFGLDLVASASIFTVFRFGLIASLGLFIMEFTRIAPKKIYPLSRGLVALVVVLVVARQLYNSVIFDPLFSTGLNIFAGVQLLAITAFILWRRARSPQQEHHWWLVPLCAIGGVLYLAEAANIYFKLMPSQMSLALDTVFQLATALLILLNFSRSERKYQAEKATSQTLSELVAVEQARQGLLARFLSGRVMKKIIAKDSVDSNLDEVIAVKEMRVAVIQADIRGFTALFRDQSAEVVALVLKDYFGPVVKQFHDIAVIKLVGDCIFAFVEESDHPGELSPVDACVEIAAHLIRRIEELTANKYADLHLSVGIGINYGQAMVGNISSDVCIDYTAIGSTVNLAARLEELTKAPFLRDLVGRNGAILGQDAVANLRKYKGVELEIATVANGVRSFSDICEVHYLRAEDCLGAVFPTAGGPTKTPKPPSARVISLQSRQQPVEDAAEGSDADLEGLQAS